MAPLDRMARLALPYQQTLANDRSRMVVVEKSRRIGGTEAYAMRAALDGLFASKTRDLWFSSRDESAAREFVMRVKHYCQTFNAVVHVVTGSEIIGGREFQVFEIAFPRGMRVTAMASSPGGFRSKGGDVILDEFAHHEQPDEMWRAAYPVITWGGRLTVLSTHNGDTGKFRELVEMGRRRREGNARPGDYPLELHTITIDDAIAQGLVERINEVTGQSLTRDEFRAQLRGGLSEEDWLEEYMCVPRSSAGSYLPYQLTRPCVHASCPRPTDSLTEFMADIGRSEGELYAGVDIGRRRDLFVIWAVSRVGSALRTAAMLVWQGRSFGEMSGAGDALMSHRTLRRVCVDASGLGMQLGEQWRIRHGSHVVEDIQITGAVKQEIYPLLRRHLEERTVMLPESDSTLADLSSIRASVTSSGHVRYLGERTEHGHADRACALALALHAAETRSQPVRFGLVVSGREVTLC